MKKTYKVQALITEEQYVTLKRMQFWAGIKEEDKGKSLSTYVRYLIQEAIDKAPLEEKQSVKNHKYGN